MLGLPFRDLPWLSFDGRAVFGSAHWKVDASTSTRPTAPPPGSTTTSRGVLAWAKQRSAPTLLVETSPRSGLTDEHVSQLMDWAERL